MNPQPNAHMRLPTLTDEVHLEGGAPDAPADAPRDFAAEGVLPESLAPADHPAHASDMPGATAPARSPAASEDEIVQRVLGELQRHVDLTLEYRLREALVPTLARISDMLIRETRVELADTLHDIVVRAVAQEIARRGSR